MTKEEKLDKLETNWKEKQKRRFAKIICNLITQTGRRYAKKYKCGIENLGVSPQRVAGIAQVVMLGATTAKNAQLAYEILILESMEGNSNGKETERSSTI